jgi:hypothetical protein
VLLDGQHGRSCYCEDRLWDNADVDHFLPWVPYPVDLGHNFVLADRRCNTKKRHRLAAKHLSAWVTRNVNMGSKLASELTAYECRTISRHRFGSLGGRTVTRTRPRR